MNNEILIDAISKIDIRLIDEYCKHKEILLKKQKRVYIKWISIAACILFMCAFAARISVAFMGNNATDRTRHGKAYSIDSIDNIASMYDDIWLVNNINNLPHRNYVLELFCTTDEYSENCDDWYSLKIAFRDNRHSYITSIIDPQGEVDDWLNHSLFNESGEIYKINDITIYLTVAHSGLYPHKNRYAATFKYRNIIYIVVRAGNDPSIVLDLVNDMLEEIDQ